MVNSLERVSWQVLACSLIGAHRSRCGAGTEANTDQSACTDCAAGWAALTGVCQECDAGKIPVADGSRCEVCLSRAPLLQLVQAMPHTSPLARVCTCIIYIDGRMSGVSRYVQLANSRTTTRVTACSALWAKPLLSVPALRAQRAGFRCQTPPETSRPDVRCVLH